MKYLLMVLLLCSCGYGRQQVILISLLQSPSNCIESDMTLNGNSIGKVVLCTKKEFVKRGCSLSPEQKAKFEEQL